MTPQGLSWGAGCDSMRRFSGLPMTGQVRADGDGSDSTGTARGMVGAYRHRAFDQQRGTRQWIAGEVHRHRSSEYLLAMSKVAHLCTRRAANREHVPAKGLFPKPCPPCLSLIDAHTEQRDRREVASGPTHALRARGATRAGCSNRSCRGYPAPASLPQAAHRRPAAAPGRPPSLPQSRGLRQWESRRRRDDGRGRRAS